MLERERKKDLFISCPLKICTVFLFDVLGSMTCELVNTYAFCNYYLGLGLQNAKLKGRERAEDILSRRVVVVVLSRVFSHAIKTD